MYLLLLETSGNQNFIFSTNKLRENIGASELTYRAGTQWVMDAVAEINTWQRPKVYLDSSSIRAALLDRTFNQPISADVEVEIIIATSGKALLLAKDQELAKQIIQAVTHKALIAAPGLDICGVISAEFDLETGDLGKMNQQVHQRFEGVRGGRSGPESRFLRLPVVAECATSGLPAMVVSRVAGDKVALRSSVSEEKRNARNRGFDRIQSLLRSRNPRFEFLGNISDFEDDFPEDISWLSVVHADGNGLGQIFLDFGKHTQGNRDYIDKYRRFSTAIDICTENAFLDAIESVFISPEQKLESGKIVIPLVPLILGGDDLTVVCDGQYALQFTEQFLTNFEQRTQHPVTLPTGEESTIISDLAQQHLPAARLSACAGITVMKKHFPFAVAYELAEDLIKSAKTIKDILKTTDGKTIPCSAIDYHILYDSSGVDLQSIRAKLDLEKFATRLYSRPYVVSEPTWYPDADRAWIDRHHWDKLAERVALINNEDNEDNYVLPNSQMHYLRESLFLGKAGADARYELIRNRYLARGIDILEGDEESLFWQELKQPTDPKSGQVFTTGLLDAMDAAGFWKGGNNE
jgi:hypothetical protein